VRQSGIDVEAEEVLRAQTSSVVQTILDEGVLKGRNPSALLMARIRQLTSGGESAEAVRGVRGPRSSAGAGADAAERTLAARLEELTDIAWDSGGTEADFEDAFRRVQSARRAYQAAHNGELEPTRKRRRSEEEEERSRGSRTWERANREHDSCASPRRRTWERGGSWSEQPRRR